MSIDRWGPPVAATIMLLNVGMGVSALLLRSHFVVADLGGIPFFAFALTGMFVAARQPRNPVGWLFMVVGTLPVIGFFSANYATYGILTRPGSLPFVEFPAWVSSWAWIPGVGTLLTFCMLLYPNGRLPSRRWRPVLYAAAVGLLLGVLGIAFTPGKMEPFEEGGPSIDNPFGLDGAEGVLQPVAEVSLGLLVFIGALSLASLVFRFRSAATGERQQMKWFMYPAGLLITVVLLETPVETMLGSTISQIVFIVAILLLPVGTGIGILRYRLFDIDVVINRTLVYLALTGILVGTYLGIVVLLQQVLTGATADSDIAIAASTLAVAALFRPLRSKVQIFIDQRFYRRKYDARRTLETFSGRLRDDVDLDHLALDLSNVVRETMQPAHVSVWLRPTPSLQENRS